MQFEKNLSLLRKKCGLSQEELAFAIDVTRQTIYSWEAGLNYPNIVMLKKIANALNVSTDDLLNGYEVNKLPNKLKYVQIENVYPQIPTPVAPNTLARYGVVTIGNIKVNI